MFSGKNFGGLNILRIILIRSFRSMSTCLHPVISAPPEQAHLIRRQVTAALALRSGCFEVGEHSVGAPGFVFEAAALAFLPSCLFTCGTLCSTTG